jgi:hypothetical protein
MTHQFIASPYPEGHVVVRPGYDGAVRIGADRYAELRDAPADAPVPAWLAGPVRAGWDTDLAGRLIGETILIRAETAYGYARASYEVNLGCNYDFLRINRADRRLSKGRVLFPRPGSLSAERAANSAGPSLRRFGRCRRPARCRAGGAGCGGDRAHGAPAGSPR